MGGVFSLSQTLYAAQNKATEDSPSSAAPHHENIIKLLTPDRVQVLAKELGLAPGLLPCLELEIARLQLGHAVFRHTSIACDRGCEGDDSVVVSDSESSWGPDSVSGPSLTEDSLDEDQADSDSDSSFEPSVPWLPRVLSSSDSDDDSNQDDEVPDRWRARRGLQTEAQGLTSAVHNQEEESESQSDNEHIGPGPSVLLLEDSFSFGGGEAKHEATRRYVMQHLAREFADSTDSNTSSSDCDDGLVQEQETSDPVN